MTLIDDVKGDGGRYGDDACITYSKHEYYVVRAVGENKFSYTLQE